MAFAPWEIDAGKTAGSYNYGSVPTTVTRSTGQVGTTTPSFVMDWPTQAPNLTPEQEMALAQYRRSASRAYQSALAEGEYARTGLRAQDLFERERLREQIRMGLREANMSLAGRGLARQPIGGGRARLLAGQAQVAGESELSMNLAQRLAEVQRAVSAAERARDEALANADLQAAILRADPARLMGVS